MTVACCYFPAVVIQDLADGPGDGFDVVFPDFAGCVSSGESPDEAVRAATEALSLHIQAMIEAGEKVPRPSDPDIIPDWLERETVKVIGFVTLPIETPEVVQRT